MSSRSRDMLQPAAREAAENYVGAVESALRGLDPESAAGVIEDIRIHLADNLGPESTPVDVRRLVETMGEPGSYANAFDTLTRERVAASESPGHGRVLGMPYDVRMPTAERIASQWWDPIEPKVFVPRVFGLGWAFNFGAIAVRMGLIEPDAEDMPLAKVPDRAFFIALGVPVAFVLSIAVTYAVFRYRLPTELPAHWNWRGEPDNYWSQATAFGFLFVMAVLPSLWALWSVVVKRPPLLRGAVIGAATLFSALSWAIWMLTLVTVLTGFARWWLPLILIVGSLFAPLLVFVYLARQGRRAEIERDLGSGGGGKR